MKERVWAIVKNKFPKDISGERHSTSAQDQSKAKQSNTVLMLARSLVSINVNYSGNGRYGEGIPIFLGGCDEAGR